MLFWISIVLFVNGFISFTYAVLSAKDSTMPWAIFAVNFVFYLGITQTGVVFSAIMRIAKSEWGRTYSRLGEVLTLSSFPIAIGIFIVLYFGGTEHLFYWASPHLLSAHGGEEISPWLGKGIFFWKNVIAMAVFYIISYIYFFTGVLKERRKTVSYDIDKRLNILAVIVMAAYIVANSFIAWDFGMTIIPEWESPIFAPYFWVGNVFGSAAFLFLVFVFHSGSKTLTNHARKDIVGGMGKLLLGYTLLWIYMWWSQFFVLFYGGIPRLFDPIRKQMEGNYTLSFWVMISALLIIPFITLLQKSVKVSVTALSVISAIICVGIWINRYLMIIPVFSDGNQLFIASWTNLSLVFGVVAAIVVSIIIFFRVFPDISPVVKDS